MTQQQQKKKEPIFCNNKCGTQIRFHKDHRTDNGGWIPLNLDLTNHECPMKKDKYPAAGTTGTPSKPSASAPNNQLTMGSQNMIIEGQIATLTQSIDELTYKVDMLTQTAQEMKKTQLEFLDRLPGLGR